MRLGRGTWDTSKILECCPFSAWWRVHRRVFYYPQIYLYITYIFASIIKLFQDNTIFKIRIQISYKAIGIEEIEPTGSQPGAIVKNRPCSWPRVSYLRASYNYATRVEGSQLLGIPDPAKRCFTWLRFHSWGRGETADTSIPGNGNWIFSPRLWKRIVRWWRGWDQETGCLGLHLGSATCRVVKFTSPGLWFYHCKVRIAVVLNNRVVLKNEWDHVHKIF